MYGSGPSRYYGFMSETTKLLLAGANVLYMGYEAVVVRGNQPDEWTNGQLSATVNIKITDPRRPFYISKQQDVYAAGCSLR